jgi:GMP synthase (glutamine-hydrolysing)
MGVIVLQHEASEGPGLLADALARRGVAMHVVHTHAGDAVPASLDAVDVPRTNALVILGGGMAVYDDDRHSHIRDELRLTEAALAAKAPVLGICFGSQLLARALGARVYAAGRQEIGWYDVTLTNDAKSDALFRDAPQSFAPFHWHGDTFDLPKGARLLARSRMTEHQAFAYADHAWGIQFHPEVTLPIVESLLGSDEAPRAGLSADALLAESRVKLPRAAEIAMAIFDHFAEVVVARS